MPQRFGDVGEFRNAAEDLFTAFGGQAALTAAFAYSRRLFLAPTGATNSHRNKFGIFFAGIARDGQSPTVA